MKKDFKLTEKEIQLIEFIRKKLPFGKCILITHNGEPQRIEQLEIIVWFRENINNEKLKEKILPS